jgi:hypothetical protein
MNGRRRGLMILKNGGAMGNVGGNRISKTIELTPLADEISEIRVNYYA